MEDETLLTPLVKPEPQIDVARLKQIMFDINRLVKMLNSIIDYDVGPVKPPPSLT